MMLYSYNHNDINPTLHIKMQIKTHMQKQAILCCSNSNGLITSDFGYSTQGERHYSFHADHTIWPHKRTVHLVMPKISVGSGPKNTTTSSILNCMTKSTICLHGPMSTIKLLFFKNLQISDQLFQSWRHLHSSPISSIGFIMTVVIVISFVDERKTTQWLCTWTNIQIVLSLTKLNGKI